jgi:hypothetical protein
MEVSRGKQYPHVGTLSLPDHFAQVHDPQDMVQPVGTRLVEDRF